MAFSLLDSFVFKAPGRVRFGCYPAQQAANPAMSSRRSTPHRLARMPTRDEAWQLVCEWTESDSLRKHMLAVETAVRAYARRLGADEETWGIAGLVHDLDYERYPDLATGHPRM